MRVLIGRMLFLGMMSACVLGVLGIAQHTFFR